MFLTNKMKIFVYHTKEMWRQYERFTEFSYLSHSIEWNVFDSESDERNDSKYTNEMSDGFKKFMHEQSVHHFKNIKWLLVYQLDPNFLKH